MGLRLPSNIGRIGGLAEISEGPFPPRGIAPFDGRAAGNGDMFGLYWPIGREGQDPLVCEALHDECTLAPAFSDLDTFLRLTDHPNDAQPAQWPSLEDDPNSPHACLGAARSASDRGEVEEACLLLSGVIERLPEYTAALGLLSSQWLRLGKYDDACRFAVRALRSPPSFAYRVDLKRVWAWLSQQEQGPDDLSDDPIWVARAALNAPPS